MRRWLALALAAALLACAAVPHTAATATAAGPDEAFINPSRISTRDGPLAIAVRNDAEMEAFKIALGAMTIIADSINNNKTISDDMVVAANAPKVPIRDILTYFGTIAAATAIDRAAQKTLGDPRRFNYPAGSDPPRHALFRFPRGKPRGICVFAHGCKHEPESWFYRSKACPMCTGLPEEVAHTKQCLARNYIVFALAPKNQSYYGRCFRSSGGELNDQPEARNVIRSFLDKYKLRSLPLYMFGISSGASFVMKFPTKGGPRVDGLISEVNMPWEDAWGATNGKGKLTDPEIWPPTVYYMMEKDLRTKRQIEAAVDLFRNNGIPSDYVYSPPWAITKSFFSDRSMLITPAQSAAISTALFSQKIYPRMLYNNGYIRLDPRLNVRWATQLMKLLPWLDNNSPKLNLIQDVSQIWQSMNLAWSWHEIVGEYVRPTLMWLESRGKANLTELVEKYDIEGKLRCLTESSEGISRKCK